MSLPAVRELVPHEPPLLAVEELIEWRPGHAQATMQLRTDNWFVREGAIESVLVLEFMAQTVAACLGMDAYQGGGNVRVGMVIACRQMQVHRARVWVGERLRLTATCARGNDSLSHYETTAHDERGELVASATLTLVHGEKPPD